MAERKVPVQTYQLDCLCDSCGTPVAQTGSKFNGSFLGHTKIGVQHEHKCPKCGAIVWADREYPAIVHEVSTGLE